jgi:ubiquinone/menaquinone biosynthesis C-methylase UbiE
MSSKSHEAGTPMPYTKAAHLLNPFREFLLSQRKMVKRLELKENYNVLEIGPGPGYYSPAVAKALSKGKLVLMDIQVEMLEMAKKRITEKGLKNVEYKQGNACSLPFANESFDVVFLVAVLGEIPDQGKCLQEIKRVLRPNGLLSVTEMRIPDPDAIPMKTLKAMIENEGYTQWSSYGKNINYTLGFHKDNKQ